MSAEAARYPAGCAMFLLALMDHTDPPAKVTVVLADEAEAEKLPLSLPLDAAVSLRGPCAEYPMMNGKTTFHVCRGHVCLPPSNELAL